MSIDLRVSDALGDLSLGGSKATEDLTRIDLLVDLSMAGRTPHELASSASGLGVVSLAGGLIDDSAIDLIAADLIVTVLESLNPFSARDTGAVGLECGVLLLDIEDGIAILEPMAVKTENVTILGHGSVDLATEELELEWVTKPRKGFGLSASTITNPYIKLGGTLTQPKLDVKPVEAITSTGMAVATGGLVLLGRGLWDRISSEKDVCAKGLSEAGRRMRGEEPKRRRRLFR